MSPATIRRVRLALGLTQEEAGAMLDVDRVSWARYESTGADSRRMSSVEWAYFQHVAGLRAIPFKPFRPRKWNGIIRERK